MVICIYNCHVIGRLRLGPRCTRWFDWDYKYFHSISEWSSADDKVKKAFDWEYKYFHSISEWSSADDKVKKALEYVDDMKPDTCVNGTGDVLQLDFDVTVWNQYTDPAIRYIFIVM